MLNQSILIGRLTKDPEIRTTPNGKAVGNITIAVGRGYKNEDGSDAVDFIPVVLWDKHAENASKYLSKGRLVAVEASIRTRNYVNNDGKKVYVTEVVAEMVKYLESGGKAKAQTAGEPSMEEEMNALDAMLG